MTEFKKILVPVDFSSNTEKLVKFAAEFSQKSGGSLHFLNVIEHVAVYEGFASAQFTSDFKKEMEKKMAALVENYKEKYGSCEAKVISGDIVDTIISQAENCDLIIIATHGYQALERILMGSVADRVVHRSPCPLLLFNPYR
jgi:nucleotide-binding universal stress UspA family protein